MLVERLHYDTSLVEVNDDKAVDLADYNGRLVMLDVAVVVEHSNLH